jgi:hypothetical protein
MSSFTKIARLEGQWVWRAGQPETANPYETNPEMFAWWLGWYELDEDHKRLYPAK